MNARMKAKVALPQPVDVKLMNLGATVLFLLCAAALLVAAALWALRHPLFALDGITVQGDVARSNPATLRANVAPQLTGNFFTVSLAATRAAFEAAPWVRHAVVRREFPNRLEVWLQEHRAVAFWGAENEGKLVNEFGEVFEANVGEVEADGLPRLSGPERESAPVLAMYRALAPLFAPLDLSVEQLTLTGRGSWQLALDTGGVVELGRGTPAEVAARTRRFLRTLTQVTAKHGRQPEAMISADLRHMGGYAVRLRGVSTTAPDAPKTQKK